MKRDTDWVSQAFLFDDEAARAKLEGMMWPEGAICPHCGEDKRIYEVRVRRGLRKCARCRRQFTIRSGTILAGSHIPLHKLFLAIFLMSTQQELAARDLQRTLALDDVKTASTLRRRISRALRRGSDRELRPGHNSATFEAIVARVLGITHADKGRTSAAKARGRMQPGK